MYTNLIIPTFSLLLLNAFASENKTKENSIYEFALNITLLTDIVVKSEQNQPPIIESTKTMTHTNVSSREIKEAHQDQCEEFLNKSSKDYKPTDEWLDTAEAIKVDCRLFLGRCVIFSKGEELSEADITDFINAYTKLPSPKDYPYPPFPRDPDLFMQHVYHKLLFRLVQDEDLVQTVLYHLGKGFTGLDFIQLFNRIGDPFNEEFDMSHFKSLLAELRDIESPDTTFLTWAAINPSLFQNYIPMLNEEQKKKAMYRILVNIHPKSENLAELGIPPLEEYPELYKGLADLLSIDGVSDKERLLEQAIFMAATANPKYYIPAYQDFIRDALQDPNTWQGHDYKTLKECLNSLIVWENIFTFLAMDKDPVLRCYAAFLAAPEKLELKDCPKATENIEFKCISDAFGDLRTNCEGEVRHMLGSKGQALLHDYCDKFLLLNPEEHQKERLAKANTNVYASYENFLSKCMPLENGKFWPVPDVGKFRSAYNKTVPPTVDIPRENDISLDMYRKLLLRLLDSELVEIIMHHSSNFNNSQRIELFNHISDHTKKGTIDSFKTLVKEIKDQEAPDPTFLRIAASVPSLFEHYIPLHDKTLSEALREAIIAAHPSGTKEELVIPTVQEYPKLYNAMIEQLQNKVFLSKDKLFEEFQSLAFLKSPGYYIPTFKEFIRRTLKDGEAKETSLCNTLKGCLNDCLLWSRVFMSFIAKEDNVSNCYAAFLAAPDKIEPEKCPEWTRDIDFECIETDKICEKRKECERDIRNQIDSSDGDVV